MQQQITLNCNGLHIFHLYLHNGRYITYGQFLNLRALNTPNIWQIRHAGMKYEIKHGIWLMVMYTSQPVSFLYDDTVMRNIPCINNLHRYVNQAFIITHNNLPNYVTVSNNIHHAPNYVRQYFLNANNGALQQRYDTIIGNSCSAWRESVLQANFQSPYVLCNTIEQYYAMQIVNPQLNLRILSPLDLNSQWLNAGDNPPQFKQLNGRAIKPNYLLYSTTPSLMNNAGITNSDIYDFANHFLNNRSINGIPYDHQPHLFYEVSNRRI